MWIKLTFHDDTPILINMEKIEAVFTIDDNGCKSSLSTDTSSYQVKESVDEVLARMVPLVSPMLVPGDFKEWK